MNFFKITVPGFCLVIVLSACNNAGNSKTADSDSTSSQKFSGTQEHPDSSEDRFIKNENQWALSEIELSKQVKQNSQNHRVKDFADMIFTDQQSARQSLSVIAKNINIDLSDSLSNLGGSDSNFLNKSISDKNYIESIQTKYEKAVNNFKTISNKNENTPLQMWVSETLPRLEKGLDSARAINSYLK